MFERMTKVSRDWTGKEPVAPAPAPVPEAGAVPVNQEEIMDSKPISNEDREAVYTFLAQHPDSNTRMTYEGAGLRTALVIEILKAGEMKGDLNVTAGARGAKFYKVARPLPVIEKQSSDASVLEADRPLPEALIS